MCKGCASGRHMRAYDDGCACKHEEPLCSHAYHAPNARVGPGSSRPPSRSRGGPGACERACVPAGCGQSWWSRKTQEAVEGLRERPVGCNAQKDGQESSGSGCRWVQQGGRESRSRQEQRDDVDGQRQKVWRVGVVVTADALRHRRRRGGGEERQTDRQGMNHLCVRLLTRSCLPGMLLHSQRPPVRATAPDPTGERPTHQPPRCAPLPQRPIFQRGLRAQPGSPSFQAVERCSQAPQM